MCERRGGALYAAAQLSPWHRGVRGRWARVAWLSPPTLGPRSTKLDGGVKARHGASAPPAPRVLVSTVERLQSCCSAVPFSAAVWGTWWLLGSRRRAAGPCQAAGAAPLRQARAERTEAQRERDTHTHTHTKQGQRKGACRDVPTRSTAPGAAHTRVSTLRKGRTVALRWTVRHCGLAPRVVAADARFGCVP